MLTITPKINTNSNFKAAPSNLYSLHEQIAALTNEVMIESSAVKKHSNIFKKIILKYRNLLFKLRLLRPVNKKYDVFENLKEVHYKNGAYRKYGSRCEKKNNYRSEKIYEVKEPDGTIKTYCNGKLESKILPDGTKIKYFKNGRVKEILNPEGKIIESNVV